MINLKRRQISLGILSGLTIPNVCLSSGGVAAEQPTTICYASAAQDRQGGQWLVRLNADCEVTGKTPLVERAHQVVRHPIKPWLLAVARRPGRVLVLADMRDGAVLTEVHAASGRHFYGHAVFTTDGRWLLTTENDIATGEGRVVVRDVQDQFRVVGEHSSFGIGPHELLLSADQTELVVANGGLRTHPDQGRKILNLDTMAPSLVRMELSSGRLLERQAPSQALHQLSVRHITANQEGVVAVALQYQGDLLDTVPLVAVQKPGMPLSWLPMPEAVRVQAHQYCGSACFDVSGNYLAVSSPRGDMVMFWNLIEARFIGQVRSRDACGLCSLPEPGTFLISNGRGEWFRTSVDALDQTQRLARQRDLAWDNHLLRV